MEKRKCPERFSTVHDRNSAVIKAVDAQGEEFTGNSPELIKRLTEVPVGRVPGSDGRE